jgi:hypothetical protein
MPLVTITCKKELCPGKDDGAVGQELAVRLNTLRLAESLPRLIVNSATELGLDPDTPEAGTQVDIREFHPYVVNGADLWIHVQFTEPYPGKDLAKRARIKFIEILSKVFHTQGFKASYAVDMFWGPGHGCLVSSSENIELAW